MRILLVEDDLMIGDSVRSALRHEGFAVDWVRDGRAAQSTLATERFDLVLLDLGLPHIDGLDVLRDMRARQDATPVIIVTARDEVSSRVAGLDAGADDYVVKPFSPRELAVRVRNLLRRTARPAPDGAVLRFGSLTIDPSAREVSVDGDLVTLTPKEFDLLLVLARSPRQVFSRRELLQLVWDSAPEYQDPATVTVHVGRLRQKLETDPDHPRWIDTVWGVGYRFEP